MKTFTQSVFAAAFTAAVCCIPLSAQAGLFDDDEARKAILELRTKVDAQQRQLDAINNGLEAKADRSGSLDLANQNEQLKQEIAKLRGEVEVLGNDLANAQQRQKDFYVDLDNRLRKLEPQRATIDGKEVNIDPSEQKAYDGALALFRQGDYKSASDTLADFLRRYPQSGYAASAQYLLGNAYYAQHDYRNAIIAQQAVVKNYPDYQKAPDALLNIASCYTELKEKSAARKTLEALISKYPGTTAAQTAKERLAVTR